MWIKVPMSGQRTLEYIHTTAPLSGIGVARLKARGPIVNSQSLSFDEGWANGIKALLGEDPTSFDFHSFFSVLSGSQAFGARQRLASHIVGWAGELFGLLAYLQCHVPTATWRNVLRVTQVDRLEKYPDFAIYDLKSNTVMMLECKAAFPVTRSSFDLDVCRHLDEKRQDGREKVKEVALRWFADGNGNRIRVSPFPCDKTIVVAGSFVDPRFKTLPPLPGYCTNASPDGCFSSCLKGSRSTTASAAFGFFQNPMARLQSFPVPFPGGRYFSKLKQLMRGAWAAAPITFWWAALELLTMVRNREENLDCGKPH